MLLKKRRGYRETTAVSSTVQTSKLVDYTTVERYIEHQSPMKKELEHLTGFLQFATKVVRLGQPFLGRLYTLEISPKYLI